MAKKKTASAYAEEIDVLHRELQASPDSDTIRKKIDYRVKKWMTLLDIHIKVANNEKTPWTKEMLGYPVIPMQTKKAIGQYQVADYVGVIETSSGDNYIDLIVERKSIEDLYGTLINEDNRSRFYREIDRFKGDVRFDRMVVIVEGTLSEFLMYQPEFNDGKFDYARQFDTNKNGIINDKKLTILSDLFVMDILVIFCDNPAISAKFCGRLFRESIRKNYAKILELSE